MYGTDEKVFHFLCPRLGQSVTFVKVYRATTSPQEGWELVDYRCSALMDERCRVPYARCPQYEPLSE